MNNKFNSYDEFMLQGINGALHDSVFKPDEIVYDCEKKIFSINVYVLMDECYQRRKFFFFVNLEKKKRRKCTLIFNNINGLTKSTELKPFAFCSIIEITYVDHKIKIITERGYEIELCSDCFMGSFEETGDIICDSFGYTDIIFSLK